MFARPSVFYAIFSQTRAQKSDKENALIRSHNSSQKNGKVPKNRAIRRFLGVFASTTIKYDTSKLLMSYFVLLKIT